jgi:hypothetical protein
MLQRADRSGPWQVWAKLLAPQSQSDLLSFGLIFWPIDNLERHSPPEHFDLEIGGVKPPFVSFSNAKPSLLAKIAERIVRPQGTTHALVHHGQAVISERLIIHWGPRPMKSRH